MSYNQIAFQHALQNNRNLWRGIVKLFEQVDRKLKVVADGALVSNLIGCFINPEVLFINAMDGAYLFLLIYPLDQLLRPMDQLQQSCKLMTIRGGGKEMVFTLYQRFANVLILNHVTDLIMQFMNFSKLSEITD